MAAKGDTLPVLAGVPVGIKDVLAMQGTPATAGSLILKGYRPPYDATAVTRLEAAGAVLLGKLNFEKEFRNTQARPEGNETVITAEPKSDNLPYSRVEFTVAPSFEIRRLRMANLDQTTLEFAFEAEKLNPPLANSLFQFQAPAGAEVVNEGGSG